MLGLSLIARDEERTLPRLLASCAGAFDEVVLVDTGSVDGTIAAFERWAEAQPGTDCRVAEFTWCDDFARARQFADDQLRSEWHAWADCDDEIRGARELRDLVARLPAEAAGLRCAYEYATGHLLTRERVVRSGRGRWVGRVHEVQEIEGPLVDVDAGLVRWVHHADSGSERAGEPRALRDLELLKAGVEADPLDTRSLFYLAKTHEELGHTDRALELYTRRLTAGGWDEEVFWSEYRLGVLRAEAGDWPGGMAALIGAWERRPWRLESLYELCWRLRVRDQHHTALVFARRGVDVPVSRDQLFVHRWIHEYGMLVELSVAAYWTGDFQESLDVTERLLAMPDLPPAHRTNALANRAFCRERLARASR
jgi:glycosyltransferase involved in cell wall biosynthesis